MKNASNDHRTLIFAIVKIAVFLWLPLPGVCDASPASTRGPTNPPHIYAPTPPYPLQARAWHRQGSGVVRVAFDEQGKAIAATMKRSTGSKILDNNTITFILNNWTSHPGKRLTVFAPVTYRLR